MKFGKAYLAERSLARPDRLALLGLALASLLTACPRPTVPVPARPNASAIRFEDVTEAARIDFTHTTGAYGEKRMPESVGPGCAFIDYDGDGRLDLLFVNSTAWPGKPGTPGHPALYRNLGSGRFRNATQEAGLELSFYGMGVAVGDYDNDGWSDLLLTGLGGNRLFRNVEGRFQDVTKRVGLDRSPPGAWHTSAAWLDYDRDGRLDLFICRYVPWTAATNVECVNGRGERIYCGPQQYAVAASVLYHNVGDAGFVDVSEQTGVAGVLGKALGVVPVDENEDGWPDLIVTNDLTPDHLLRNHAGQRFVEVGAQAGLAVGVSGVPRAGMGVDVADVHNDRTLSVGIGNFSGEGLALFHRNSSGLYRDEAAASGVLAPSRRRLTFGVAFLDANGDGWPDFLALNGHVDDLIEESGTDTAYAQRPLMLMNRQGRFTDVTDAAGEALQLKVVGRGMAIGDYDNDGRPDVLVAVNAGPGRLWRNQSTIASWVGFRLVGTESNRDGYGAEVRLTAGGLTQRRWIRSGGSYLAASDPRALFGLGSSTKIDNVEIRWPSGTIDRYADVEPLAYYRAVEGAEDLAPATNNSRAEVRTVPTR